MKNRKNVLDVVLLLALPASGKSEARKYISSVSPEVLKKDFCMGNIIQLDDYPHVHFMREVDKILIAHNEQPIFFKSNDKPFWDPRDWGTLIHLLNEDFARLGTGWKEKSTRKMDAMFARIDKAAAKVGIASRSGDVNEGARHVLAYHLEPYCAEVFADLEKECAKPMEDATVLIEFSRGGPKGAKMPLQPPMGYQHSLALMSLEILRRASILYIQVDPEQSRAKNIARMPPPDFKGDTGVFHFVPHEVMDHDYGGDDINYMMEKSPAVNTVELIKEGGVVTYLPIAMLDNRHDLTTFAQEKDRAKWPPEKMMALHNALSHAMRLLMTLNP